MASSANSNRHPALAAYERNYADARRSFRSHRQEARRTSAASPAAAASEEAVEADPTLRDGSPSHAEP